LLPLSAISIPHGAIITLIGNGNEQRDTDISIPHGAIITRGLPDSVGGRIEFQFLMVQL
jgi:hypothetical protein